MKSVIKMDNLSIKSRFKDFLVPILALLFILSCSPSDRWKWHMKQGQYKEAIPILKKAVAANPRNWVSQNDIGLAYCRIGSYGLAEAHLERAVELRPNNTTSLKNLGIAKLYIGDFNGANNVFTQAMHINPSDWVAHLLLAEAYWALRKPEKAIDEAKKSISLNPEQKVPHMIWAASFDLMGQYKKAAEHYIKSSGSGIPWVIYGGKAGRPPAVMFHDRSIIAAHRYFLARDWAKAKELLKQTDIRRTMIGVVLKRHERGALVIEVLPGYPAEKAGIQKGDIIAEINGETMDIRSLVDYVTRSTAGVPLKATVIKGEQRLKISITPMGVGNMGLAWCNLAMGEYDNALKCFQKNLQTTGGMNYTWGPGQRGISIALFKKGEEEKSRKAWGWAYLGAEISCNTETGHISIYWIWPRTPAKLSGLKVGDCILSYAGSNVSAKSWRDVLTFLERISHTPIGLEVPVKVLRDEKELDLMVTLKRHPMLKEK